MPLPISPAAERNKQPILERLREVLGHSGRILEISSGTGQHVLHFAQALPHWEWQPSEADPQWLPIIAQRIAESALTNIRPPVLLDVLRQPWPSSEAPFAEAFNAIFCANMLHISAPETVPALMRGASHNLCPGGVLVTYGPYFEDGPAAASNVAFDADLKARNPTWGIRRLRDVEQQAHAQGMALTARYEMPANNLLLVFSRPHSASI